MSVCKKLSVFAVSVILLLSLIPCIFQASALSVSAGSAILIDAKSGLVLFEKNADKVRSMASTTKIMTAVVAIERYDLDANVKIPAAAVGIEGSSIYLCEGEVLTLRQLLYALLLSSANDAATAIALHCAGSIEAFADMMNDTARRLGLVNTHFDNPHGLDSDSHYTTAKDLAKLAAYAITLNEFKTISSTYKAQIPMAGTENARLLVNHNKLLRSYDGIIGVKTGFTKKSGRCLVSAAERDGTILVAVTLNAPDDWADHKAMLDFGFDNYSSVDLTKDIAPLPLPVISGDVSTLQCAPKEPLSAMLPRDHGTILCRIEMDRFAYAPVKQNEVVGRIYYFCDGCELGCTDIITLQESRLKKQKYTIWDRISDFFAR